MAGLGIDRLHGSRVFGSREELMGSRKEGFWGSMLRRNWKKSGSQKDSPISKGRLGSGSQGINGSVAVDSDATGSSSCVKSTAAVCPGEVASRDSY